MNIFNLPSPNFDERAGVPIDMLVIHYTGMHDPLAALDRLCDAAAKVSAHYTIAEQGVIYRMVAEEKRAWHAGVSQWRGQENINHRSVGIELINPGHEWGYRPFPAVQMQALVDLSKEIIARYNISARNVVAHSDIAPQRKKDPGELFKWRAIAAQGVGLWPQVDLGSGARAASKDLAVYGYDISDLPAAIVAFQRHYRPSRFDGVWDSECSALLAALLQMV